MAWNTELVSIVRELIYDTDSVRYTDFRLQSSILTSAQLMMTEVSFDTTYTVDLVASGISPDPTASGARDNNYINLTCLKTACLVLGGEAKDYGRNAMVIKDASATADFSKAFDAVKENAKDMCNKYEDYKTQFALGKAPGTAIITPSVVESIYPTTFN